MPLTTFFPVQTRKNERGRVCVCVCVCVCQWEREREREKREGHSIALFLTNTRNRTTGQRTHINCQGLKVIRTFCFQLNNWTFDNNFTERHPSKLRKWSLVQSFPFACWFFVFVFHLWQHGVDFSTDSTRRCWATWGTEDTGATTGANYLEWQTRMLER